MENSVLIISPKSYPYFNSNYKGVYGGAEVQLSEIGKSLAKRDWSVTFLVGDYSQPKISVIDSCVCYKAFGSNLPKAIQFLQICKGIYKTKCKFIIQRTMTPVTWILAIVSRLLKGRFIYMVAHDREVEKTHELNKTLIGRIVVKLAFYFSNVVFVQNEYEQECLSKYYTQNSYILKKILPEINQISDPVQNTYDLVWIGRSEIWKHPEVVIEFAKRNSSITIAMICPKATNDDGLFQFLKEISDCLENVSFFDGLPYTETQEILKKSKLYLFTSKLEGDWPMVVLEAANHSLPVIAFYKQYNDLIEKYNGGIFCEGDVSVLDDMVLKLLSDVNLYSQMSSGARQYIKDKHPKQEIINKLETLLLEVTN